MDDVLDNVGVEDVEASADAEPSGIELDGEAERAQAEESGFADGGDSQEAVGSLADNDDGLDVSN